MKNKSLLAAFLVLGAILAATTYAVGPKQGTQVRQQAQSWEYAELTLEDENRVVWDPSGTNVVPQVRTLRDQYARLGGNQRATFVNLLGQIGSDRWELVSVTQSVWTFKRLR